jgi:hypoxanthine phosphoribosyltransferase
VQKEFVLDESYGQYAGQQVEELLSEDEIQTRIREMGQQISDDFKDQIPILIGVLNGSFIFFADLFRELEINAEVDFIKISSYADRTKSSGTVRLLKDISCDISDRDVIVIEDIIDSGLTLRFLKKRLEESGTRSVRFAALLIKESTQVDFPIHYVGFRIPDRYVIGYGLDLAQKLRNLKSVYAFK